ncbi:AraC family transcriptional regulator [Flammeovirga sp. SubArs3]|uniref:helix-turn-helix domain-containing protein n=1 Tax=Flammeovirga sp. SubArs3 TaxID=2995316 RepID=UPI00248CE00E|nr:AraC family transcriptional regulator [Flammeovirga sp. SubArs3]
MHKEIIHDFNQHKQWLQNYFQGEFVHPNLLKVDSEMGKGFVYFYKIHPSNYFMLFRVEARQDLNLQIDYSASSYFKYVASFFNTDLWIESNDGNIQHEIKWSGFYTCTKDMAVNGTVKKGELLKRVSIFFSDDALNEIDDLQVNQYYTNKKQFFHFFEEQTDLKAFRLMLLEILNYSDILQTKVLSVKMQELYYIFLNGLKRVDTTVGHHPRKITNNQLAALFKIRERILDDLSQRPDVSQLVAETGLDKTQIQQLFHEVFGFTIYNYFTVRRMDKIKDILLEGSMNTSEIAEKFGFTHLQHFSNSFKKYYGLSPRKFLKEHSF